MLIKTHHDGFNHTLSSEITPRDIYAGRRDLMKLMATGVAGAAMASWAGREALAQGTVRPGKLAALPGAKSAVAGAMVMDKLTGYK
ncbi:MAG: protein-methionine-sulfoxide reductase catalytic subunit MsrP, partial [Rhodoferax sp.]|nr:protein-methionine-sulfoxide reductase catalytic subunit MsrP [Rhodoferax sp.]